MNNIINAVFQKGSSYAYVPGIWQYDYGQILRIQGLNLPTAVEVHFSLNETGGDSITRIGVTQDGVTDAPVPDTFLENGDADKDYKIYAFVYLADSVSGNTVYKVSMQVKARPKPEVPGTPEEPELFREAVKAVNEAADRAEKAADSAAVSASEAEKSATEASSAAGAAINAEKRIENLEEEIKKAGQDSENAIKQQEIISKQAVTEHTNTEITRMQEAAAESENSLKESITDSETAKKNLDESVKTAGTAQTALDKSIEDASTGKAALDASVTKAGTAQTALDKSIADATAGKTALDKTNQTATSLKTELEKDITAGSQLKTDLKTAGDTAMKAIQDEAATQLDKVQHASDDIIADREQIAQNKDDIEALSKTVNANIPDDAIVGDKPWTSKHIIDMLCPPLEASGNPVQCYPVAGYPLGITASWEPVQEGSGDPSPDNIRPIKGRDNVTIQRCGENLVDVSQCVAKSVNGITFTPQSDGGISIQGTASAQAEYTILLHCVIPQKTTVSIAGIGQATDSCLAILRNEENWGVNCSVGGKNTGTLREYADRFELRVRNGAVLDFVTYPFVTIGSTVPAKYVPYQGDTVTLSLPETIYSGEVDTVTGEGNENIKIVTLDGNKLKFSLSNIYYNLPMHSAPGIAKNGVVGCSHFNSRLFAVNTNYEFCFMLASDAAGLFANVDELNAYLVAQNDAGTPVQIAYKLATPTPFTATGAQPIPALAGANTVLTDADSVAVTGREDLLHVLSGIQSSE